MSGIEIRLTALDLMLEMSGTGFVELNVKLLALKQSQRPRRRDMTKDFNPFYLGEGLASVASTTPV